MSRNFGLGQRDMGRAGKIAIDRNYQSYQSRESVSQRWSQFVTYIKDLGIRRMEHIQTDHIRGFADSLKSSDLSASTQQNYISAVNRVMEIARQDREVRLNPAEVCDRRSGIAKTDGSVSRSEHQQTVSQVEPRIGVLLELQREFGLRFEESAKFDARSALNQAVEKNHIEISRGTKGGQSRYIEIRNNIQLRVLERASEIQENDRSMIPCDRSYIEFKHSAYSAIGKTNINFHSERHAYAQNRYKEITNISAPVKTNHSERTWSHYLSRQLGIGIRDAKELDSEARLLISKELGHHREDVVSAYIGGKL